MKLLKPTACLPAVGGGNVKGQTMMEDAVAEGLSDRGSTPLRSTLEPDLKSLGSRINKGRKETSITRFSSETYMR